MYFSIKLFCYIKIKYYICSTEMNQLTLKITTKHYEQLHRTHNRDINTGV